MAKGKGKGRFGLMGVGMEEMGPSRARVRSSFKNRHARVPVLMHVSRVSLACLLQFQEARLAASRAPPCPPHAPSIRAQGGRFRA